MPRVLGTREMRKIQDPYNLFFPPPHFNTNCHFASWRKVAKKSRIFSIVSSKSWNYKQNRRFPRRLSRYEFLFRYRRVGSYCFQIEFFPSNYPQNITEIRECVCALYNDDGLWISSTLGLYNLWIFCVPFVWVLVEVLMLEATSTYIPIRICMQTILRCKVSLLHRKDPPPRAIVSISAKTRPKVCEFPTPRY